MRRILICVVVLSFMTPALARGVEVWNQVSLLPPYNHCSHRDTTYWQYNYHPVSLQLNSTIDCDSGYAHLYASTGIISAWPGVAGDRWTHADAWFEHFYFTVAESGEYKVLVDFDFNGLLGVSVPRLKDLYGKQVASTELKVEVVIACQDELTGFWANVLHEQLFHKHMISEYTGTSELVALVDTSGVFESGSVHLDEQEWLWPYNKKRYKVGVRVFATNHLWTWGDGSAWSVSVFEPKTDFDFCGQAYDIDGHVDVRSITVQRDPMDTEPPVTTANPGPEHALCFPLNLIYLDATDGDGHGGEGFGVADTWWWWADAPGQRYLYSGGGILLEVDREICMYSEDMVGNVEPVRCLTY